jgi:hypothetical protein
MIQLPNSVQYLPVIYNEFKFWAGFATVVVAGYSAYQWVKAIRTNDLPHIQAGVLALTTEMKEQTGSFVKAMESNTSELKELRRDLFNAFVSAPPRARAAKAAKRKK